MPQIQKAKAAGRTLVIPLGRPRLERCLFSWEMKQWTREDLLGLVQRDTGRQPGSVRVAAGTVV